MPEPLHDEGRATQSAEDAATERAAPGHALLALQARAGNAAVSRLVQTKLEVGAADDPAEAEADRTAAAAMEHLHGGDPIDALLRSVGGVARAPVDDPVIGAAGGTLDQDTDARIEQARGGGQPLDGELQRSMESAFDADFSNVRVHDDGAAHELSDQLGARAFTTGTDIFFAQGSYSPGSESGQELVAHELTHVVQQREGAVLPSAQLSRAAGPEDVQVIRRDATIVTDWSTESDVKGTFGSKTRSKPLKQLGRAVADWAGMRGFNLPYNFGPNLLHVANVEAAIAAWEASKKDAAESIRADAIGRLKAFVAERRDVFEDIQEKKRAKQEVATGLHETFHEMEPDLAAYAGRNTDAYGVDRFEDVTDGSVSDMLSKTRKADGSLDTAAVDGLTAKDTAAGDGEVATSVAATIDVPDDASIADIEALLADPQHLNPLTGKTMFPELANLLAEMKGDAVPVADVTAVKQVGPTSITATYNPADVNFDARWTQVQTAVSKVQAAGWTVPSFKLHLPKLGRDLTVKKDTGKCSVVEGKKSNRAVFWAPDLMHVSSANYENPLADTTSIDTAKTVDGLKFSSSWLDNTGVGTIVHELGHMLHFNHDAAKFQGLWGAIFKGKESEEDDARSFQQIAIEQVSEYGGKPREFVAEVFLGLVYGQTYEPIVMEIYAKLGGAPKA